MGCKEQLTIDAVILKQAQVKRRNLSMCYIDYSKAFDSVPHDWLRKILEIYKIHPSIRNLLGTLMEQWNTCLYLGSDKLGEIKIKRGIFQGDTLSPLWFVMALNPLSTLLNFDNYGYRLNIKEDTRVSHLMYMDDIKLYSENKTQLHSLIRTTKLFSDDIQMAFGLDKCATINIKKGKNEVNNETIEDIEPLNLEDTYTYLGIAQHQNINHTSLKSKFKEMYRLRLTKLLNTRLNSINLVTAINTWAVPVLTYSFGILKYSEVDLHELDRMTRRMLTKFRMHHPRSAVERLYLKREQGGRGLINIFQLCKQQETSLRKYFQISQSQLLQKVVKADDGYSALDLKSVRNEEEVRIGHNNLIAWQEKVLHGKYPAELQKATNDKDGSLSWLKRGQLHPETEGFIISIQDRVIRTRNYERVILKQNVVDICRKCRKPGETIEHVTAGCSALSDNAYLARHNQVAKVIHSELAKKYNLINNPPPYYKYIPEPVLESTENLLYWDRQIITDRTVDYNRPDIVIIEKQNKTAIIIDIGCPLTHNLQKTESEKITKYENLAIELKNIWGLEKVAIIPIIISVCGVMTKHLKENIKRLGLPQYLAQIIQKSVILQTCHITRKFLAN